MAEGRNLRVGGMPAGLIAVALLAAGLFLPGLGWLPLVDEDETRFGSVAREMMRSGDWIVPRFNGELADKPAGLFWVIGAGFAIFGESPAGARFGSALCGVATVIMTWFLAKILHGPRAAFWSSAALSTSLLFVVESRAATADSALLAVITGMLLLAVRFWWSGRSFRFVALPQTTALAIGLLAGIGILLKGLVAVAVPLVCFFVFAFWALPASGSGLRALCGRVRLASQTMRPVLVLGAALLVAAPWHIAVALRTGGEWLELFYWKHHFVRATSVMEGHGGFPFLQLPLLFAGMFPWSVFLPLAVWRTIQQAVLQNWAARLLLVWAGVWILLFSLTATQLPNYVLPAYPALCLCIGNLISRALASPGSMVDGWFYAACAGLFIGGCMVAAGAWVAADSAGLHELRELAWLGLPPAAGAILAAAAVSWASRKSAMGMFLGAAVALMIGCFFLVAPRIGKLDPVPRLVTKADKIAGGTAVLATFRFTVPGVIWSAGRPVKVCRSASEAVSFLLSAPGRSLVLVGADAYDELAAQSAVRTEIVGDGQPLLRRGKVLLVRAL